VGVREGTNVGEVHVRGQVEGADQFEDRGEVFDQGVIRDAAEGVREGVVFTVIDDKGGTSTDFKQRDDLLSDS